MAKETRTKAQINAQRIRHEWNKKNMRSFAFQCHNKYDQDIIEWLERAKANGESMGAIIKTALRFYMQHK